MRRRHRSRYYMLAAAACFTILFGLTFYFEQPAPSGVIVERNEKADDIQLMLGDEVITFENRVELSLHENGSMSVHQESTAGEVIALRDNPGVKLSVPYGKQSSLSLPDGSKVWLNSGSVLEFPSRFSASSRTISLEGEIFIEVAENKEKPFIVNTPGFNVRVYGTAFNVSAYGDSGSSDQVVLVEGEVSVESEQLREVRLSPSEMVEFTDQGIEKKKVNTDRYTSWKDGYLTCNDTPISEVLRLLERYYNVSFTYTDELNIEEMTCTGKIYLSRNIDNVITTLSLLTSTEYHFREREESEIK